MDMFNYAGKVVVVTGARQGLGKVFVRAFAERGAQVVLMARNLSALEEAAEEISRETGAQCHVCQIDVLDERSVEKAAAFANGIAGHVDVLVNNAAVGRGSVPLQDVALEEWNEAIGTNLTGTFLCMKHFGRLMIAKGAGVIINLSSLCAKVAVKGVYTGAYDCSKAGISALTKYMAAEWAQYGVRVNAISPGFFLTDINKAYLEENPEFYERSLDAIPLKRWGNPNELGALAVFLASDEAAYITGADYNADGGYPIW